MISDVIRLKMIEFCKKICETILLSYNKDKVVDEMLQSSNDRYGHSNKGKKQWNLTSNLLTVQILGTENRMYQGNHHLLSHLIC